MDIDWDEAKNRRNVKKHGVSFEQAAQVFGDPYALTQPDLADDSGEDRLITLGAIGPGSVLFVVHLWLDEKTIWIISARVATSRERKAYEEAHNRTVTKGRRGRQARRRH
jgi:uncharacterized DUF497 family protein